MREEIGEHNVTVDTLVVLVRLTHVRRAPDMGRMS